jgi:hypothetical protein
MDVISHLPPLGHDDVDAEQGREAASFWLNREHVLDLVEHRSAKSSAYRRCQFGLSGAG